MRSHALRAATAAMLAAAMSLPRPAAAQWAVIDQANLAQNVLTAAHTLQQINNQIASLQNQATMIQNMSKNLSHLSFSSLSAIANDLQQIGNLMNQAQRISFEVSAVQSALNRRYPSSYGAGVNLTQVVSNAQSRWQDAQSAFQQTLLVQSEIAQTVQSDTAKLTQLVTASQGAAGNLQVVQAGNQLLALEIKQQLQLQTLLAAQGRAQALSGASATQSEAEGHAAFTTFLGSSSAYTPQ
jgi:P-type conjugative transfer protein TrbJ